MSTYVELKKIYAQREEVDINDLEKDLELLKPELRKNYPEIANIMDINKYFLTLNQQLVKEYIRLEFNLHQ